MSHIVGSNIPGLRVAFDIVMRWLDFDAPLGVAEAISLQSAFEEAVQQPENMFVAANKKNAVVIHNHQFFAMKVPQGKEAWFRYLAEDREGLAIDREGLFVGNFLPSENECEAEGHSTIVGIMFDSTDNNRKFTLK